MKKTISKILCVMMIFTLSLCFTSCKEEASVPKDKTPFAIITMEDGSVMKAELYPEDAPITVSNFIKLAESGFYDGLTFHRIISDTLIQGGDPEGTGMGGSDQTIKGEFPSNGVDNKRRHETGALSMARTSAPDSASSQFFIVVNGERCESLDGDYAVFGKLTEGIEVASKISDLPSAPNQMPINKVVIKSIKIIYQE